MRDLVTIGQVWEHRKNGRVRVVQVHRADQQVQVMAVDPIGIRGSLLINFRDLKRYWRRVEDA
jgi:hypothetical protein